MNKKILLLTMSLLALVMLVTPVLAKPSSRGPINSAGKNPNANLGESTPPGGYPVAKLDLMTPSGLINRWINYPDSTSRVVIKPDNKFYCTAVEIGDMWWLAFNATNAGKWVHMSETGLAGLSITFGSDAPDIGDADGVYFKWKALEK